MTEKVQINGFEVFVEGKGEETILMIHGWPDNYSLWDEQVDALKERYRCIRFTLPGFDPKHKREAWTVKDLGDLFRAIVEQLSPDQPVILMLHDWGSYFGYHFYNRHPEMVSKIVSADVGDWVSWRKNSSFYTIFSAFAYQIVLAICWKLGPRFGTPITRWMGKAMGSHTPTELISANMNYPYWYMWFGGEDSYKRRFEAFDPQCPFLYFYGGDKPIMFQDESWLQRQKNKPGNKMVATQENHWLTKNAPDFFNKVVLDWLNTE